MKSSDVRERSTRIAVKAAPQATARTSAVDQPGTSSVEGVWLRCHSTHRLCTQSGIE